MTYEGRLLKSEKYRQQFFENLGKIFVPANILKMFGAYYQDTLVAALFIMAYQDKVTYYYGGTSNQYRNTMANYLLQWEVIKYAKTCGYKLYDFWGIEDGTKHTAYWQGITRFKRGFNGQEISYLGFYRKVYNPFEYFIYNSFKKIRNIF